MPPKECDPRCTGRCNKNRLPVVITSEKGCDPKCTGRCSKKNVGTSPPEKRDIKDKPIEKIEVCPPEDKEQPKPTEGRDKIDALIPCAPENKEVKDEDPQEIESIPAEKKEFPDGDKPPEEESQLTPIKQSASKTDETGKISCVIMDLDGVILDIETVYEFVIRDLVKKYGIAEAEIQHIIDLQDKETSTKFCSDYKLTISPQDFMVEFRNTALKQLADASLMPGIQSLMDYLTKNKYPVAVASNSSEEAYNHKTQKHNKFFQKFSHIVLAGSDPEVKVRKPSPKVYEVCGSRFQSKPDPKNILVLEDAPDGVSAAIGAGMNVIWFPNKYATKEDVKGALAILNSINEFNPQEFGLVPMK